MEMNNTNQRWEKVIQRNFPPLAWTTGAHYEFKGFNIGSLKWKRGREIIVKYKQTQSFVIQNPSAYNISNIKELINEINIDFEKAIDQYNDQIYSTVRMNFNNSRDDLNLINELHRTVYALMLIGYDVVIDVKELIDKSIQNPDSQLVSYLETPWKPTAVQREREAIFDAAGEIEVDYGKKILLLEKLSEEFGYLHQDYLGKIWTAHDYEKAFLEKVNLKSFMDDSFDLSHFSDYEQWLISIFKKFLYMYEEGRNAMVRCAWGMKNCMQNLGYDPKTILYMTSDEVSAFAKGEIDLISEQLVTKREKAFALYFEEDKYHEFSGEEAVKKLIDEQVIGSFWEDSSEVNSELKGSIAFKGYVKGKARLVFTQKDADALEEGEILISPMTQVEFLSGIRKCAAIVTDEGGIICHAAIVAREFGKPCVLATQRATKVFKNGDIIEVDANNGIVRLIS